MQIGVHSWSSAISSRQWCKLCITKGIVAAKRSARACFHSGKKGVGEVYQEDKEAILPVVRSACDVDHLGIWVDDRCTCPRETIEEEKKTDTRFVRYSDDHVDRRHQPRIRVI